LSKTGDDIYGRPSYIYLLYSEIVDYAQIYNSFVIL